MNIIEKTPALTGLMLHMSVDITTQLRIFSGSVEWEGCLPLSLGQRPAFIVLST